MSQEDIDRRKAGRGWDSLSRQAQLVRLRRLACTALGVFGIEGARMTLLRHQDNTTFRVQTGGGAYVLRINRPQVHTAQTIESEMAWLSALRRETDLGCSRTRPFG